MKYNIFFTKTAKCATESIRFYLREYAENNNLIINGALYESYFEIYDFNLNTNHIFYNKEYINHFTKNKDKALPTLFISSVRNPIERLYSHYCYGNFWFEKGLDFNKWYETYSMDENLNGWLVPEWGDMTDNYMWNYMGIKSLSTISKQYNFIFVKEKFDSCLENFEKILGYKFKKTYIKNVNPKSDNNFIFDDRIIDMFNERNKLDINLYNYIYNLY